MTVGDVMSTRLLTVEASLPLTEAAREMHGHSVGAVLVLTGGHVSGILTERDVLRAVATGRVEGTHVAAWMTRDPETVDVSEPKVKRNLTVLQADASRTPRVTRNTVARATRRIASPQVAGPSAGETTPPKPRALTAC